MSDPSRPPPSPEPGDSDDAPDTGPDGRTGSRSRSRDRSGEHGVHLATIGGVPVYLGSSWLLIGIVLMFFYGPTLQRSYPGLGAVAYLVAALYAVILLASVLIHEAAHAVAARQCGYPVDRVVANLWGGHTAYSPARATPSRSAFIAVVGPLTNLAVAVIGWFALPLIDSDIPYLLTWATTYANGLVAVFNLLPGLPLDGGYLVDAVVWKLTGSRARGMVAAGWSGRIITLVLVGWVLWTMFAAGGSVDMFSLVWMALIAALLWTGASQAIRSGRGALRLDALSLRDLTRHAILVPGTAPLADAIRKGAEWGGSAVVLVLDARAQPVGILDTRPAAGLSAAELAAAPAGAFAVVQPPGWIVDTRPDHPLDVSAVVTLMGSLPAPLIALRAPSGQVYGVVVADDVQAALSRR